jgi:PAS domain S-box-containing protein
VTRILVVDDDGQNRYLLEVVLEGSGYEVSSTSNGIEALAAAREAPPDLAISDILMPGMDGFVLCKEWRADPRLGHIPFIFYTATYTEDEDERFALSLGGDRFLRKPVEPEILLAEVAKVLSAPRRAVAAPTDPEAELVFLALHDRALARKLFQKHEQLQRSERKYRNYFDDSPVAIVVVDAAGAFLDVNPAACRLAGRSASELLGMRLLDLLEPGSPGDLPQLLASPAGSLPLPESFGLRRPDGVPRDVAVTAIRLEGNIVLAFCEDVTDRKRAEDEVRSANASLERRVAARTVQLEQVNRELEAFAYSVSHDLRAPLRALDGYSALLEQDAAERLDETCRGYLASIRRSAARMSTLIDDLLTLSRASRQDLRVGPVDMDALVKHVLREVLPAGELERTDVVVHPLPAAVGDEGLLRQVWTNLLNNAVKFSSKRPRRSIEVGSRTEGGETAYFVRDNGVGFAPEFGPKLFNAFQRLHDGRDFEGTGVGLALVRRIVERHGGRIGAESLVDGGATFWFTLGGSPAS